MRTNNPCDRDVSFSFECDNVHGIWMAVVYPVGLGAGRAVGRLLAATLKTFRGFSIVRQI